MSGRRSGATRSPVLAAAGLPEDWVAEAVRIRNALDRLLVEDALHHASEENAAAMRREPACVRGHRRPRRHRLPA